MPGMLDTSLNLGLNDRSVHGLAQATANEGFAWDCYRRLIEMFGEVVYGVPRERFEVRTDQTPRLEDVKAHVEQFKFVYEFPQDPDEQLPRSIRAVFDSWMGERAVHYRRINRIPDDWGTAVNVQRMVFGNKGECSATGVAFNRGELTGAPAPSGTFW
jgi:pyruvate, orthophosphate dikinase